MCAVTQSQPALSLGKRWVCAGLTTSDRSYRNKQTQYAPCTVSHFQLLIGNLFRKFKKVSVTKVGHLLTPYFITGGTTTKLFHVKPFQKP